MPEFFLCLVSGVVWTNYDRRKKWDILIHCYPDTSTIFTPWSEPNLVLNWAHPRVLVGFVLLDL